MREEVISPIRNRLLLAFSLLFLIMGIGVTGYMLIEGWGFLDSLYMTVISLTTVGYGETHPLHTHGRIFTIFLITGGMGILAYGIGSFTAFLVEGHLVRILRLRKMDKKIQRLRNHMILCGYEGEGRYVLEEFAKTSTPYVVIGKNAAAFVEMFQKKVPLFIEGDPTKDNALIQANIQNARGLVSAMSTDSENLLVVLSARELNPKLRIISCVFDRENEHKFRRVGADGTVMATFIGGLRMASEAIRPTVVTFLDRMLRDKDQSLRIEEVQVPEGTSELLGKSLKEIEFSRKTGLLVVAVKPAAQASYLYNPRGEYVLNKGDIFIVIGGMAELKNAKRLLGYVVDDQPEEEE